jgi:hypothetical protein
MSTTAPRALTSGCTTRQPMVSVGDGHAVRGPGNRRVRAHSGIQSWGARRSAGNRWGVRVQVADRHSPQRARFGRPPDLVAADRHFFSTENCRQATAAGVRRVALPKRGQVRPADRARERAPWFRRGHRFRAGIEGRISVLRRRFGQRRCRYHGPAGLERWVGLGILAHNLRVISRNVSRRRAA